MEIFFNQHGGCFTAKKFPLYTVRDYKKKLQLRLLREGKYKITFHLTVAVFSVTEHDEGYKENKICYT